MIIQSKFYQSLFNQENIPILYIGFQKKLLYPLSLRLAQPSTFHFVYGEKEGIGEVDKVLSPDHLAAFICVRNLGHKTSEVKIHDKVRTVEEWHKYFISYDLDSYLKALKKFKFFNEIKDKLRLSLEPLVPFYTVNRYFGV